MLDSAVQRCFGCGAPAPADALPPLCPGCASGGPHVAPADRRWRARLSDGRVEGPLSREGVEDRFARGQLDAFSPVSRGEGPWMPLAEHPDFRSTFLPWSADAGRLDRAREALRGARRSERRRRGMRVARAAALLALSAGALWVGLTTDLFVLPERWTRRFGETASRAGQAVNDRVTAARGTEEAAAVLARGRALPHDDVVAAIVEPLGPVDGSEGLHLARARVALWTGGAALATAREEAERALARAPEDVEANALLAEVYAAALADRPDLAVTAGQLVDRAWAAAADAVSARRARGAVALAAGDREAAREAVAECAEVDAGCALVRARAAGDGAALAELSERLGAPFPVELARGEVALEAGRLLLAEEVAGRLVREHAGEAAAQDLLARAARATGRWEVALEAARAAERLAPDRLAARALRARIELRVEGRPGDALDEVEAVRAHPGFAGFDGAAAVLVDGALAARRLGRFEEALELARAALDREPGHPAAALEAARALLALGRKEEASVALGEADATHLSGHALARFDVARAGVLRALGRERLARTTLVAARDADPGWPRARLALAEIDLAVGDPAGAVDGVLAAPLLDAVTRRDPLAAMPLDEPDWSVLAGTLRERLSTDPRLGARVREAVAVLAWADGDPSAPTLLRAAAGADEGAAAARAALAWLAFAEGDAPRTRQLAAEVRALADSAPLHAALEGWALARMGDGAAARKALDAALGDGAEIAGVHELRARAFAILGDREAERAAWTEVLRLAPLHATARVELERLAAAED